MKVELGLTSCVIAYGLSSWPVIVLVDNPAYSSCIDSNLTASHCSSLHSPVEAVAAHPYGAYALAILAFGIALIGWGVAQKRQTGQEWSLGKRHWALLGLGGVLFLWMALTIQGIGLLGSSINRSGSEITVSDPYFLQSGIAGMVLGVVGSVMILVGVIGTIESFFPNRPPSV
jgi:membrane protease YdiL (CAAX protease family)